MNEKITKVKSWFKIALKEVGNVITNLLVPAVSVVTVIAELLPFIPSKWVLVLKQVEYWAFYASATAEDLEEKVAKEIEEKQAEINK